MQRLPFNRNPEDGQVLVKVKSCGLNFADIYTRQGLVRDEPGPPFIMGLECSGVVAGVGAKVENLKVILETYSIYHTRFQCNIHSMI